MESKKELQMACQQKIDVTNFENQLADFKKKFGNNYRLASERFHKAIDEIDVIINQVIVEYYNEYFHPFTSFTDTNREKLRKLTLKNPALKAKFDEATQDKPSNRD